MGGVAVSPGEAQGAGADWGAWFPRDAAVTPVQAVTRATGVRVMTVLPDEPRAAPAESSAVVEGDAGPVVHTRLCVIQTLQSPRNPNAANEEENNFARGDSG